MTGLVHVAPAAASAILNMGWYMWDLLQLVLSSSLLPGGPLLEVRVAIDVLVPVREHYKKFKLTKKFIVIRHWTPIKFGKIL